MASNQDSFFDDPLEDYKPKPKFPFDSDYEDDTYEVDFDCPVCTIKASEHSTKQLVECALMELRYSKRGDKT